MLLYLVLDFVFYVSGGILNGLELVFVLVKLSSEALEFLGGIFDGLKGEAVCDEFLVVCVVDVDLHLVDVVKHQAELEVLMILWHISYSNIFLCIMIQILFRYISCVILIGRVG